MNRREFVTSAAILALGGRAFGQQCGPVPGFPYPAVRGCTAEVDIDAVISTQDCYDYCWAACMHMIFTLNGHTLSQESIARQALNIAEDNPTPCASIGGSLKFRNALSRKYVDQDGNSFRVKLNAFFDPGNGISTMDNRLVASALSAGRPLIYCNQTHAMVNYKFVYEDGPLGIVPRQVWVVDPWPPNVRKRMLSGPEATGAPIGTMTFVADVVVSDD